MMVGNLNSQFLYHLRGGGHSHLYQNANGDTFLGPVMQLSGDNFTFGDGQLSRHSVVHVGGVVVGSRIKRHRGGGIYS